MQSLTHGSVFQTSDEPFITEFNYKDVGIDIRPYITQNFYLEAADIERFNYIEKAFPELELRRRFEQYPGVLHHFIILRIEDMNGKMHYGVTSTDRMVYPFIIQRCKELEVTTAPSLRKRGIGFTFYNENIDFYEGFLSWKNKTKRWIVENKLSYYCEDYYVKEQKDNLRISREIVDRAKNGAYDHSDFVGYSKPHNKWKSEEAVYRITKDLYKDYQVIYQYSPFYLATDKGCMSYDIYICGLKVAIEYQGKQHFEPVDFFGGEDNFAKQQARDKLKAQRSEENGVKLVYINYWDDITPSLIKERVDEAIAGENRRDGRPNI